VGPLTWPPGPSANAFGWRAARAVPIAASGTVAVAEHRNSGHALTALLFASREPSTRSSGRKQLRIAHDMFVSIGAEAFAERARCERLATGETVRKRTVETRDDLTANHTGSVSTWSNTPHPEVVRVAPSGLREHFVCKEAVRIA
jgi:hypothetical protein